MADGDTWNGDTRRGDRLRATSLARALSGPVRAVGRVLPHTETSTPPEPPGSEDGPEAPHNAAVLDCGLYVDGVRSGGRIGYAEAEKRARGRKDAFVWLGLHDPSAEDFADIASTFGLPELAVEDAITAFQRPKLERYDDVTFMVVRTVRYVREGALTATSDLVDTGEVMLFVAPHFVITVRHGAACRLDGVREALEQRQDRLRLGPWAVLHAVSDEVVDRFVEVVDRIEDDIDELEASVLAPTANDVQRIYQLKREVVELRRAASPLGRPLDTLVDGGVPGVPSKIREHIRDVADHHHRNTDQIVSFDDLLTSILQASLAQTGIQQNNDMRKISAWVAIAAVPTALAGIYGMNFDHMPELHWTFGYPLMLAVTSVICALLYRRFKRTGWL